MSIFDNLLNTLIECAEKSYKAKRQKQDTLPLYVEIEYFPPFENRIKESAIRQYQKAKHTKEAMLFRSKLYLASKVNN